MAKKRKKAQTPKQLKIAMAVAVGVLFILGLIQIVQGFIDTRNYSDQIIEAIQKQTDRKVTIKGTVTVSLLPVPTLFIPGIELRDPVSDKPAPALTVDMVSIQVPFMSIFTDKITISAISLNRPILELVRADDNFIYWDWMNASLLKALSANNASSGRALKFMITDGSILYRDNQSEKSTTIENINSVLSNGKTMTGGGSFQIGGHDLTFSVDNNPADTGPAPFQLKVNSGSKDSLELQGKLDVSGDLPDLKGKFTLKVENASYWVQAVKTQEKHLFQQVTNQFSSKGDNKVVLPLKITSNWTQHGLGVLMDDFVLEGINSAGAGKVKLTWAEWKPNVQVDMKFSGFNYDQWSQLVGHAFSKGDSDAIVYHEINEAQANPIPENINLTLNLNADMIYFGQQIWKDAQMSANIGSGTVTINQLNLKLQGDSVVSIFGVISPSTTSDLRFEGSMETSGKSLRKMLTVFDETAADLPETGFGDFFAHSNMFISSSQLRLSEADVKLGDLHLNGGLVAYFDTNPRVEADIKLKNISFDYFRDVWREKQKNSDKQEDFFLKFDKTTNFTWLKKLQTAIDFKVVVKHFTFLDRKGENASFRLYAKNGDLGLYDVNFIYPNDITKGFFKLNVNGEQPAMTLNLTTNEVNTDYFSVEPYKASGPASSAPQKTPGAEAKPVSVSATDTASAITPLPVPDATAPANTMEPLPSPVVKLNESAQDRMDATALANKLKALAASNASTPADKLGTLPVPAAATAPASKTGDAKKLEIKPQAETIRVAANDEFEPPKAIGGIDELVRHRDLTDPYFAGQNKKHWSEKLFDMSWLGGYSGEFDLNINRLIHKDIGLGNLKMKASFGNDQILFKTLSFSYWGGQCSIAGSLYGGKVPGFAVSFTLVNASVQALLASLTERHNISGQVSISASVTSSGVNMLSWVSQAEGKVVLIGRNIYVQGINMQGVIDGVEISRTSSDVLNSVNRAIFNGDTIFSVDGNLNIKDGLIRTPGIGLRTATSQGNLMGELRLVPWTLELAALFQFPSMSTETVPTLTLQYSGTPDSGELKTDTSSLESFVAKRIISQ